jgi:hypothetical protein
MSWMKARWGITATAAVMLALTFSPMAGNACVATCDDPDNLDFPDLTAECWQWLEGGYVLPPFAIPYGYSLFDMAEETAVYNVGIFVGDTPTPPDVPFEVLEGDTTVSPGTILYVPIFFADNSPPLPSYGFPKNIADQEADADYLDFVVFTDYGVTAFFVQVDGENTILDDDYITGVKTAPLADGGGNRYISTACFLSPLTRGAHTVGFGGIVDGAPVVFISHTVTVR